MFPGSPPRPAKIRKKDAFGVAVLFGSAFPEQGVEVGVEIEGEEVVDPLAYTNEADGEAALVGAGDEDAALRAAVELGEDESGDAEGGTELANLGKGVLAGGGTATSLL